MHHLAGKYQNFPGGACPQTPLAVGAFGTSFCRIRLPLLKILATAPKYRILLYSTVQAIYFCHQHD